MTVRIGKVELIGVQDIHTEETRNLVEQRVPDQKGSLFQDLGRDPVTVVIIGLLFGSEVLSNLEQLRQAQEKADPLSFAADIAIGTELTEVIIEDLKIRQLAGYVDRYRFAIRVREHVEPPESPEKSLAVVNEGIAADADAFAADSIAAGGALQDPSNLSNVLADNPGALAQMSAADLAGAVADHADKLSPDDVGGILKSVGIQDPAKMGGMLTALRDKGTLGGLMEKFAAAGKDIMQMLKDVDLIGVAKTIVKLFSIGVELIKSLKKLWEEIKNVTGSLLSDPEKFIRSITDAVEKGVEQLENLLEAIRNLVSTIGEVVDLLNKAIQDHPKIAAELNSKDVFQNIVTNVIKGLEKVEEALTVIANQMVQLAGASALIGLTRPLIKEGKKLIVSAGSFIGDITGPEVVGDAENLIQKVAESSLGTVDDVLKLVEVLLGTDLDSDLISLKKEFSDLREKITGLTEQITGGDG